MWTAKTDLFESAGVKTVQLARAEVMCAYSRAIEAFLVSQRFSVDSETTWERYRVWTDNIISGFGAKTPFSNFIWLKVD